MNLPHRALALALAAALLGACASFDPNNLLFRRGAPAGAQAHTPVPDPASPVLGEEGRRAALDFVWSTVNERYYDPAFNGVDWAAARGRWEPRALAAPDDEAFWTLLDRMTGELRDSHTRVESPARAARIERYESVTLGFAYRPLEGRLAVTSVSPDSDAWWAGVRPGMTIAQVEGEPAAAAWSRALAESREGSTTNAKHLTAARRMLEGEPGTRATLAFERADGSTFAAKLERRSAVRAPRLAHRVLPSGLGYIRLSHWSPSLEGEFVAAIARLKDTPGLVIDLRDNPGGSALMVRNVAAQFFAGKIAFGRALTRTGRPITLAFDWIEVIKLRQELEGRNAYSGPVAVLVNAASGSGSELFAGLLQSQKRASIVGETTCGCLLAYMGYASVPGGGRLAYSEVGFAFPDGSRVEGTGIRPDTPVAPAIADLLADRDRALEAAQAHLEAQAAAQGSAPKPPGASA